MAALSSADSCYTQLLYPAPGLIVSQFEKFLSAPLVSEKQYFFWASSPSHPLIHSRVKPGCPSCILTQHAVRCGSVEESGAPEAMHGRVTLGLPPKAACVRHTLVQNCLKTMFMCAFKKNPELCYMCKYLCTYFYANFISVAMGSPTNHGLKIIF